MKTLTAIRNVSGIAFLIGVVIACGWETRLDFVAFAEAGLTIIAGFITVWASSKLVK